MKIIVVISVVEVQNSLIINFRNVFFRFKINMSGWHASRLEFFRIVSVDLGSPWILFLSNPRSKLLTFGVILEFLGLNF